MPDLPDRLCRTCQIDYAGPEIANNPLITLPSEVVAQGTAAILEYLNHQAAWHLRQLIGQAAAGVGAIAGAMLALRWRRHRRMDKKKRVQRRFSRSSKG